MKKNDFKPLKLLMSEYMGDRENLGFIISLKNQWKEISGEMLSSVSYPFRFSKGVLYVALNDNAWMSEAPYIKPMLIGKLSKIGIEAKDIRFSLSKIGRNNKDISPALPPLSEDDKNLVLKASELIEDKKLKDAFCSAMTNCLRK